MKIALLAGSYPPTNCGIGNYTYQLATALRQQGVGVEVICGDNWRLTNIGNIVKTIRAIDPAVLHLQYPTVGFGKKLTPQILSLAVPGVVTLHEISEAHILRKLSLYPFAVRSKHIIFTTPYERYFAIRRAPWIAGRSSVIPIGSNIATSKLTPERKLDEIVYFGLFRPRKGLEELISLASFIKERSLPCHVHMIGKPYPDDSPYFRELIQQSRDLPIKWSIGLEDSVIADSLSRAAIAYMPFPDGASGRRGSLLAVLANGVATITTRGAHTPSELEEAVLFSRNPDEALQLIEHVRSDRDLRLRLSKNGRAYAETFNWDAIARQHIALYERILH